MRDAVRQFGTVTCRGGIGLIIFWDGRVLEERNERQEARGRCEGQEEDFLPLR